MPEKERKKVLSLKALNLEQGTFLKIYKKSIIFKAKLR